MNIITLENFKKAMDWNTVEFTEEQLQTILNSVNTEYKTLEELKTELEIDEDYTTIFFDINLDAVIEGFTHNGFDAQTITNMSIAHYGNCLDLYYLEDDKIYAGVSGTR